MRLYNKLRIVVRVSPKLKQKQKMKSSCHKAPVERRHQKNSLSVPRSTREPEVPSFITTTRAYPSSKFKFNTTQMNRWLSRHIQEEAVCDESDHYVLEEEEHDVEREPEKSPRQTPRPKLGAEAMVEFYGKYKDMNKAASAFHYKAKSAAYQYLREIESFRQLPKPMGIVKWKGPANELNLQ